MTHLVIVESPAKCQKIQGFLGAGWRVIATMGHIRALEQDLEAIGLTRDFEAKYEWIKEKSKAIKQLKECGKEAEEVYLASDGDREGEGIAYAVCLLLKLNPKTAKRAVFHEITQTAVQNAVKNPRLLDMNQVHAQQTRAILDMMIGFTISPLLWRYVAPALSAGRCQTPALRLVVEREDQIQQFKTSSSWALSIQWNSAWDAHMEDELEDQESAHNYMEQVYQQPKGTILEKTISPWTESSPPPLMTSTLQQQASALFGLNPKSTMKIAQKLYEGGHITYMRTDKAVLSEEAVQQGKEWVQSQYGEAYVGGAIKKKKEQKVEAVVQAQEAHEAIRPTHMDRQEVDGDALEKKVYRLIWQRAIQSCMSAARGETCKIRSQIHDDTDFVWRSQWKRTVFDGWKRAGQVASIEEEEEEKEGGWAITETLKVGDSIEWTKMEAAPKETKAQGRYTEATLVRALETQGIGRPSTFASLLSVIQEKGYVETRDLPPKEIQIKQYQTTPGQWPPTETLQKKKVGAEKKKLVPTPLGRSVLEFAVKHFDDLFAYGFTAHMEQQLDAIAKGSIQNEKVVLRTMWESYKERYETLLRSSANQAGGSAKIKSFANGLKAVQSKKGPLLLIEGIVKKDTQFLGWPDGVSWDQMTEEIAKAFQGGQKPLGMWKDQPIQKKSGKFGDYLQCGAVSIPYQEEPLEQTIVRLEAKSSAVMKTYKEYVIRTGQYGPYIMKTSLKKPQFVSLPQGLDPANLTEKEVEALYKLGLETRKKWKK
jgi:DNA topoisomerase-1